MFDSFQNKPVSSFQQIIENQLEDLYKYKLVARKQVSLKANDHIDDVAFSLSQLASFKPITIVGDGNCLFRAISKAMYGSEEHHFELRYRSLVELVIRKHEFLDYARNNFETNWFEHLSPGAYCALLFCI